MKSGAEIFNIMYNYVYTRPPDHRRICAILVLVLIKKSVNMTINCHASQF